MQFNYYSMVEARALVTNYYQPTRARRLWRHYLSSLTGGAGSLLLTVVFYPLFSRRMDTRHLRIEYPQIRLQSGFGNVSSPAFRSNLDRSLGKYNFLGIMSLKCVLLFNFIFQFYHLLANRFQCNIHIFGK